jgi:hypothetical protein
MRINGFIGGLGELMSESVFYLCIDTSDGYDPKLSGFEDHDVYAPRRCVVRKELKGIASLDTWDRMRADIDARRHWLLAIDPPYRYDTEILDRVIVWASGGVMWPPEQVDSHRVPLLSNPMVDSVSVVPARFDGPSVDDLDVVDISSQTTQLARSATILRNERDALLEAHYNRNAM